MDKVEDISSPQKLTRLGPTVLFKEVNEAKGGITPPIQMYSDSDEGKGGTGEL